MTVADPAKMSPLKDDSSPLLFPFWYLKLSQNRVQTGFYGIQAQQLFNLAVVEASKKRTSAYDIELCNQSASTNSRTFSKYRQLAIPHVIENALQTNRLHHTIQRTLQSNQHTKSKNGVESPPSPLTTHWRAVYRYDELVPRASRLSNRKKNPKKSGDQKPMQASRPTCRCSSSLWVWAPCTLILKSTSWIL